MSQNVDVVRRLYEAFETRDNVLPFEVYDREIEWYPGPIEGVGFEPPEDLQPLAAQRSRRQCAPRNGLPAANWGQMPAVLDPLGARRTPPPDTTEVPARDS